MMSSFRGPLQHHTEVLATAIRQAKDIKCTHWKGRHKTASFTDDLTVYVENMKKLTKKMTVTSEQF